MRAVEVSRYGGPEVLQLVDRPAPKLREGQVRVAVKAIGVNYLDVQERTGAYPRTLPYIPGDEGSGTIIEVGPGVERSIGERVCWQGITGSYAEELAIPADRLIAVPDSISDHLAAALPTQGLTAHYLATDAYQITPGDVVVILAGAGGVGLLLTQIAKLQGARVITAVSTPEKARLSQNAGADRVVAYADLADAVRQATGVEDAGAEPAEAVHAGAEPASPVHAGAGRAQAVHTTAVRAGGDLAKSVHAGAELAKSVHAGAELAEVVHAGGESAETVHAGVGHAEAVRPGADVVYDSVGGATFEDSLAALGRRGTLVLYGQSSGPVPPFELMRLRHGSLTVIRPTLRDYVVGDELQKRAADLFAWVEQGHVTPQIGGVYRLDDVAQAHADLEGRRTSGKLLLVP
jgi:NADPH:quinone reductase-like Zn-dependent oxidoreductase